MEICSKCRHYWNPHLYIQKIEDLTVYSAIKYSPVAKSILLSAKESGVRRADEMILDALLNLTKRIPTKYLRNAILLPIPGSKRAIRKRGRDFIFDLTQELSTRSGIAMYSGLEITRGLLDQSQLSARDRSRNIHGAFEFKNPLNGKSKSMLLNPVIDQAINPEIFLVDDLVTTGSTLLEAKRALNAHGIEVNRAITACMAQTLNIGH